MAAPLHQHVSSERSLVEGALARCPLCFVEGPIRRVGEHMAEDHASPTKVGWRVSLDPALRRPLAALCEQHGLAFADLINAAVVYQLAFVERRR